MVGGKIMKIKVEKQVAECQRGIVGIITHYDVNSGIHYGFQLTDPHKNWQSKDPKIRGKVKRVEL